MQLFKKIEYKSSLIFRIGIFLLVSAPSIASLFFLLSIILIIFQDPKGVLQNKWNYPFYLCSFILLISVLFNKNSIQGWDNSLNWIGLSNWIPYFICFFSFQSYTKSYEARKTIIYSFLLGSVPLLFSAFGQYFFNWTGPISVLNNLIIWFQRPIANDHGLTGLFNNANYAGSWFLIIWPMALVFLNQTKINFYKKNLILVFTIFILISIFLTRSRNAWIGSILSLPFLSNFYLLTFLVLVIFFFLLISLFLIQPVLLLQFPFISKIIFPNFIRKEFLTLGFENIYQFTRVKIWIEALNFIIEKPLLGWGAASFPILFNLNNKNLSYSHSHNLFLELAISYGLPVSLIFLLFVVIILYKSFLKIYNFKKYGNQCPFDKAWWTATFTLFLSQLVDIQYFDFRIGLTFWIFLAGLVSINKNKSINQLNNF